MASDIIFLLKRPQKIDPTLQEKHPNLRVTEYPNHIEIDTTESSSTYFKNPSQLEKIKETIYSFCLPFTKICLISFADDASPYSDQINPLQEGLISFDEMVKLFRNHLLPQENMHGLFAELEDGSFIVPNWFCETISPTGMNPRANQSR